MNLKIVIDTKILKFWGTLQDNIKGNLGKILKNCERNKEQNEFKETFE